jgi:hypothetical protein
VTRERTHYFEGQLLSAEDLAQDQLYFRERTRRHNRSLHGWGVVSGLDVAPGTGKLEILVSPGYAIDPRGEEIFVEGEVAVDLCREHRDDDTVLPCDSDEEGESRDVVERSPGQRLYVAVRYMECYSRPVPVPGGMGESTAYTRIREGFQISALAALPDASLESWVVLAEVTVGSRHRVANIDPVTDRRRVGA